MNTKKHFTTFELVNVYAYFNTEFPAEQAKELPTKIRWNLKRNLEKIAPIAKGFEEFRDNLLEELQKEWFVPEKTDEVMQTKMDENNNPVLDENGNEVTEKMMKIKDEFMDDYQDAVNLLNSKLQEILLESNEIDILSVDLDAFVDSVSNDSAITFDSLNMLSFMDETTNVVSGEA